MAASTDERSLLDVTTELPDHESLEVCAVSNDASEYDMLEAERLPRHRSAPPNASKAAPIVRGPRLGCLAKCAPAGQVLN